MSIVFQVVRNFFSKVSEEFSLFLSLFQRKKSIGQADSLKLLADASSLVEKVNFS